MERYTVNLTIDVFVDSDNWNEMMEEHNSDWEYWCSEDIVYDMIYEELGFYSGERDSIYLDNIHINQVKNEEDE